MFNFIVDVSGSDEATTCRLIEGDVISVFCFMNTERGLDTVGGVNVKGVCVRSNFTQHYDGRVRRFDTGHQS